MSIFSTTQNRHTASQKGMTLIEVMVSLSIFALVVGGALSLFSSASTTQGATQLKTELAAVRSAVKNLYMGQAYPVADLTNALFTAKKLPSTMTTTSVTVPGTNGAANTTTTTNTHGMNGTFAVTGLAGGNTFSVDFNGLSQELCIQFLTGASGWGAIAVNTTTNVTPIPVTTSTAVTACGTGANSVKFTSI